MKNYILALFLFFFVIIATYFVTVDNTIVNVKEVSSENICKVSEIKEENEQYILNSYMPVTKINELNLEIEKNYNVIIDGFKKEILNLKQLENEKKFTLNINFTNYEYENYISFIISFSYDLGGAHPDTDIITINYNKESNSFVNIDTLISENENILDVFSNQSYEVLKNNKELLENEEILKKAISPNKENFEKFVFSKYGIILFFPNYTIASYDLGSFEVLIGYDYL